MNENETKKYMVKVLIKGDSVPRYFTDCYAPYIEGGLYCIFDGVSVYKYPVAILDGVRETPQDALKQESEE